LRVEPRDRLEQVPALAGPSARSQGPASDVERYRDLVAVVSHDLGAPQRILERGGSDVHPRCAGGQCGRDGFVVAQPAGQLHSDIH
jgi:hypothetical protein